MSKTKNEQLGMPIGTAANKLRKLIIFDLIGKLGKDICFQCGERIETEKELSIEHKVPYLHSENPQELYFDMDNIAFSHLSCNCASARPKTPKHPSWQAYKDGCRCKECTEINTEKVSYYRSRRK